MRPMILNEARFFWNFKRLALTKDGMAGVPPWIIQMNRRDCGRIVEFGAILQFSLGV